MMALAFQLYIGFVLLHGAFMKSIQNTTYHDISIASLKSAVDRLEERIENLTAIQTKGQTPVYRPISFFVRLSQVTTLNKNSIVKFDEVSINEGNHFNPGDGIFVAPVSGTYQFSWTTLTTSGKLVETEMRVDNVIKESLHISLGTGIISGTKVVLCKVKKGDHVWIQTSKTYGANYFHIANANAKSSFTGMLIHEL